MKINVLLVNFQQKIVLNIHRNIYNKMEMFRDAIMDNILRIINVMIVLMNALNVIH